MPAPGGSFARHLRDPVYANGLALVVNAGLSSLLGFAFWMVAARRFPADALGVGAAVVSAATLAALVGKAGFDAALIRYAPACSRDDVRRLLVRSTLSAVGLTAFVAAVVLFLAVEGVPALGVLLVPAFAVGFVLLAVGTAAAWMLDAYYIADQRAVLVLARNLAFNAVKLVVPLVVAIAWAGRAVPLAWVVGLTVSLVVAFAFLPRRLAAHRPTGSVPASPAFGYAMRNYTLNLAEFLPGLLLPILVLQALGPEANARFFLAWTIATVAFLASKAISQSAFAALVRADRPAAALRKGILLSAVVLVPAAVVFYAGAPTLLGLFGEDYRTEGAGLLRLLALSIVPVAITNLYLACLKARDAGWELTLLPAINLAILLPAIPIALAWKGIEGVGIAWLAVQSAAGLYAAARLVAKLRRNMHDNATSLRRHPHQG